jgi:hypothetical protein
VGVFIYEGYLSNMKYIITENQMGKFERLVRKDLNKYFTPFIGWENVKRHIEETTENYPPDIFTKIYINYHGLGANYYGYQLYSEFVKDQVIGLLRVDELRYNYLTRKYNRLWIPILMKWFEEKTGYPVKDIGFNW